MRSVQTTALSELAQLRPHTRNTAMSFPNVFGINETGFSDLPSLSLEAFHSPSVSATPPPPCGQSLAMRPAGKENHWRGASITPIGIPLGENHTCLGKRRHSSLVFGGILRIMHAARTSIKTPPTITRKWRVAAKTNFSICKKDISIGTASWASHLHPKIRCHFWAQMVNTENVGRILVENPHMKITQRHNTYDFCPSSVPFEQFLGPTMPSCTKKSEHCKCAPLAA